MFQGDVYLGVSNGFFRGIPVGELVVFLEKAGLKLATVVSHVQRLYLTLKAFITKTYTDTLSRLLGSMLRQFCQGNTAK